MGPKHAACNDPVENGGIRSGNRYECLKGFYLNTAIYVNASGQWQVFYGNTSDTKSMQCERVGWNLPGTSLTGLRVTAMYCHEANLWAYVNCGPTDVNFDYRTLQFEFYWFDFPTTLKHYTCYEGESLAYTLNAVRTYGFGKKLFCGTNAATKAREWQWSTMEGTETAPIPFGAKMSCF
ncbi:hypothetical protein PENTCL1PPCAC_3389 [Pristionchus entomophagus]|uniref:C-type lectin domain-containing protein n=1 Tax=Pristionchus entomophagus TaxID=358040 RepID=A0AAV5SED1_9BILA|nr:hypothetical protein PENTCL1PPCAC_3389 [Pristionchus entomophagus]